jgi:hypothetical protein
LRSALSMMSIVTLSTFSLRKGLRLFWMIFAGMAAS